MSKYPDSIDKITKARLRLSAFGSVVSIALTMFFIGTLACFAYFSTQYIHNLSKKIEMEILFYADVKEADIVSMEQRMKMEPFIAASRVSSRQENTQEAIKTIGNNYTDIISNPINASIIISVSPEYANSDSLQQISKRIKKEQIVQDVQYPDFLVKSISNNFRTLQWVVLIISAVFMLISMLLIANSIRLHIYAKRFNIKSMLLVGATRSFVRGPFVLKGLSQGVWGGAIAVVLLGLLLYQGNLLFPQFVDFSQILYVSLILLAVFVFSIFFTVMVSIISVNRYIRIKDERLYL
ncbi:MAG: permease-like cell division protein FtsX [Bacteroidales bacterium]|nr:permease-like cell division protein FtsX [Bacteroidales bacterium]